ncbi:MAG: transposase [Acidobacteria bacterium SCN 69-37]|nr:MAG: transposase [Acidobacteria bacterium SCN 69-37]
MKLLTAPERARLLANGQIRAQAERDNPDAAIDFYPVVKLFTPDAGCTWLLTEIDPDDNDRAFGLCDLGMGSPELGYVSLAELSAVRGRLGLPVERDLQFRPSKPLSAYADHARAVGGISA